MVANVSFNPLLVTVASGTFGVSSNGMVQGVAMDDPAVRYALAGGVLASAESLPMWGGVAVFEHIPFSDEDLDTMGPFLGRATSVATIAGFSVFNQASNWINTPQSPVPIAGNGFTVPFYRLGSGARIAVACDPSLVSLEGGVSNPNVSWDFNAQRLQPYVASGPTIGVTSVTWSSTAGGRGAVVMTAPATNVGGVGDSVNISGATNTGTGGDSAVNGNFIVDTFTSTSAFTIAMPADANVIGTIAGTIVLNVGIGAIPVKILGFNIGNSKIVVYDEDTGFVTWNNSGSTALILI